MENFTAIVNGFKSLTIVTKLFILDICEGPGDACCTPKAFLASEPIEIKAAYFLHFDGKQNIFKTVVNCIIFFLLLSIFLFVDD